MLVDTSVWVEFFNRPGGPEHLRVNQLLDEKKLAKLMRLVGASSKTEAINTAIDEALRARARSRLKGLAGRVQLAEDWRELRQRDLGS